MRSNTRSNLTYRHHSRQVETSTSRRPQIFKNVDQVRVSKFLAARYYYLDLGKSRIEVKPLFWYSIYTTNSKSGGQLWRNFHVRGLRNFGITLIERYFHICWDYNWCSKYLVCQVGIWVMRAGQCDSKVQSTSRCYSDASQWQKRRRLWLMRWVGYVFSVVSTASNLNLLMYESLTTWLCESSLISKSTIYYLAISSGISFIPMIIQFITPFPHLLKCRIWRSLSPAQVFVLWTHLSTMQS